MDTLKGVLETGGVHGVFTEVELDEVLGFGKGDERFVFTADHVMRNVKGHEFGEVSVDGRESFEVVVGEIESLEVGHYCYRQFPDAVMAEVEGF